MITACRMSESRGNNESKYTSRNSHVWKSEAKWSFGHRPFKGPYFCQFIKKPCVRHHFGRFMLCSDWWVVAAASFGLMHRSCQQICKLAASPFLFLGFIWRTCPRSRPVCRGRVQTVCLSPRWENTLKGWFETFPSYSLFFHVHRHFMSECSWR